MAGKSPMQKIQDAGATPERDQPGAGKGSSVTLEAMQEKYGKKAGAEVFHRISLAGGFGDFRNMPYLTSQSLDTTHLKGKEREAVEAVLAEADANSKPAAGAAED